MKTIHFLLLFFLSTIIGTAQTDLIQNVSSGGEQFSTENTTLDFTIGGMAGDLNSTNYQLNIGFQQPEYSDAIALSIKPTTAFFAKAKANQIELGWRTDLSVNGQFMIEYSTDQLHWETIGQVQQQVNRVDYQFFYTQLVNQAYYRISFINRDAHLLWTSNIQTINLASSIRIYPNPVQAFLNIQVNQEPHHINIIDANGKSVVAFQLSDQKNINVVDYAKGTYFIVVKNIANRSTETFPLIIK